VVPGAHWRLYEEEDSEEPIFKQSTAGEWVMNNSQAWCVLMERRADTAEENAPKNPLFEYCSKKITESWEKNESGASACQKLRSCLVGLLKPQGSSATPPTVRLSCPPPASPRCKTFSRASAAAPAAATASKAAQDESGKVTVEVASDTTRASIQRSK